MAHRRRGIIAGLPREIREQINQQLEEGWKYKRISAWLVTQGHAGITEKHLSVWYQGGFKDWVARRERLEEMRVRMEFAREMVKDTEDNSFQEGGLQMAAMQFFELFCQLDLASMQAELQAKPEVYVRLVNSMVRLCKSRMEMQRFKREEAANAPTKLTPEEQQRMREIFGISEEYAGMAEAANRREEAGEPVAIVQVQAAETEETEQGREEGEVGTAVNPGYSELIRVDGGKKIATEPRRDAKGHEFTPMGMGTAKAQGELAAKGRR
ncbi:MAG: hypothetical protein JWQ71_2765, partial [Pedosphaera sp.]|nr:hypothetical protein [Pedosphaera sp.]